MKIANAMARGAIKITNSHPKNGMCTHERRYAQRAQGNQFVNKLIAVIKQKRAQGGCLGTKSRRKT